MLAHRSCHGCGRSGSIASSSINRPAVVRISSPNFRKELTCRTNQLICWAAYIRPSTGSTFSFAPWCRLGSYRCSQTTPSDCRHFLTLSTGLVNFSFCSLSIGRPLTTEKCLRESAHQIRAVFIGLTDNLWLRCSSKARSGWVDLVRIFSPIA